MTDQTQQAMEREAFEAWYEREKFGGFKRSMWEAWQARAALSPAAPAVGAPVAMPAVEGLTATDEMFAAVRAINGDISSRDTTEIIESVLALAASPVPMASSAGEPMASSDAASWAKEWGVVKSVVFEETGAQRTDYVFSSDRFGHMLDAFERHCRAIYAPPAASLREQEDVLLRVIQRLNANPYNLTKMECIAEVEAMRDAQRLGREKGNAS